MQYRMTADGASASGTIRLESKKKIFQVSGDYNAVFKAEGTINKKLESDVFDRYLVGVGKSIASKWLQYEAKAISKFTSKLNKAEKEIEKLAKTEGQGKIKARVAALEYQFKADLQSELENQMKGFVAKAHSDAVSAMDKAAKAVLKDRKKLVLKAVLIVTGLAVTIGATIATLPAGGAGGVVAVAVIGCITAAMEAAVDGLKLSNEFIGNYKTYNKSLGELSSKLDETIKYARACEAKRDRLLIHRAQVEMKMNEIKKADPGGALKGNSQLKSLESQFKAMNDSLNKLSDYSANDVEKALSSARSAVRQLEGDPYQERGTKASAALSMFIKLAGGASKAIEGLSKD